MREWTEEEDLFLIENIQKMDITKLMTHYKCSHRRIMARLEYFQMEKQKYKAGHFVLDNDLYLCVYSKVHPEKYLVVDIEDYDKVINFAWNIKTSTSDNTFYAVTRENGRNFYIHQHLLDYYGELKIDHIDGNGLNNRRSNLRLVTHNQNLCNAKVYKGKKSKYKGVQFDKNSKKCWQVWIRRKYLKRFENELEAALYYDEVAKQEYGEYARLNFPDSISQ
jgi:hypothetical protein